MANSKKQKTQEAPPPEREHCNIWGYPDLSAVAADISGGIHSGLLAGYFVFAYRSGGSGNIKRLVVTRSGPDTWMYGIVTQGWTGYIPKIPKEGLYGLLLDDMKADKIKPEIIEDFKYFVEQ